MKNLIFNSPQPFTITSKEVWAKVQCLQNPKFGDFQVQYSAVKIVILVSCQDQCHQPMCEKYKKADIKVF